MTEQFPASRQLRLAGYVFELPNNFAPGYVLTENDALFMNTAHQSSAANTFAPKAKEIIETLTKEGKNEKQIQEAVQKALSEHYAGYTWTPRGVGESIDPIDREIRKQARGELQQALAGRGVALNSQPEDVRENLLDQWIGKHGARIRKEVEARQKKLASMLDDFDLSGVKSKDDAPATTEAA